MSSGKIIFREAVHNDNENLIRLNEITPMPGSLSLLIDRRPDFFSLLEKRGKYTIFIAEKDDKIIGSCSTTEMKVFVEKQPINALYVSDFRIHPDYQKTLLAARLGKYVYEKMKEMDTKLYFALVVSDNHTVKPFISGRWLFPNVFGESQLNVYQLIATDLIPGSKKYKLVDIKKPDLETFRSSYLERFSFYTDIYKNDDNNTHVLAAYNKNDELVASIALTDTESYKQEIITGIPKHLQLLINTVDFVNKIHKIINLPHLNESIRILYIRFFQFNEGYESALHFLINEAMKIAFARKMHFLTVGIHDKSPFNSYFKRYPKITFKVSVLFSGKDLDKKIVESIENGYVYWDFTL